MKEFFERRSGVSLALIALGGFILFVAFEYVVVKIIQGAFAGLS